jgi:hypothetical protein
MPLIQWVMQNLSSNLGGAVAGGSATVSGGFLIVPKGGATASGKALYQKVFSIIPSGGALLGGKSSIEERYGVNTTRKILHLPGDIVYDETNKPWIVVSFEFSTSNSEAKYNINNNIKNEFLYDSQITDFFSDYLNYLEKETLDKINSLSNQPEYSRNLLGMRKISFEDKKTTKKDTLSFDKIIAELKTKPLENLPTYSGKRIIKT